MECRKQLWQVTAVTRDFKAKNKTGENLVLSAWLLSVPIIVKQRCLQCTRAENKRTKKMVPYILRVSLQIPLIHWGLVYSSFAFPSTRNAITPARKRTCSLQTTKHTQGYLAERLLWQSLVSNHQCLFIIAKPWCSTFPACWEVCVLCWDLA